MEIWDWKMWHSLFQTLITPVLLYGCEIRGPSIPKSTWKQLEWVQKHLIMNSLKVKNSTRYEKLLVESGLYPIDLGALRKNDFI
jgi:hypothetical protein